MASSRRGGHIIWANGDRHLADYALRQIRKAIAAAIARNDAADIEYLRGREASALAEVERVEALRSSMLARNCELRTGNCQA